jgi:hypothetical protein
MVKKLKVPTRIAGMKVPKAARKGPLGTFSVPRQGGC